MNLLVVQMAVVVVGGTFLVVATITLGLSVLRRHRDRRSERRDVRIQRAVFGKLAEPEPDWDAFVDELSRGEQRAAERILESLLRDVRGTVREQLLDAARALKLGPRAERRLRSKDVVDRQLGLTTLALLDHPIPIERISEMRTEPVTLREPAARLLYERREEFDSASNRGTWLLLSRGKDVLTVYGVETLFRLNRRGATPLLTIGYRHAHRWQPDLTVQVLAVLSRCQVTTSTEAFGWVCESLDHDDPAVRAAAVSAFGNLGWHAELRAKLSLGTTLDDPNQRVRRAAYRVLGRWGDDQARAWLRWALVTEFDPMSRVSLCRALAEAAGTDVDGPALADNPAWEWIVAERDAVGSASTSLSEPSDDLAEGMIG